MQSGLKAPRVRALQVHQLVQEDTTCICRTCNQREIYQSTACIYKADSIKHVRGLPLAL